ncbi:zinc-binding alcohol dehydrogenase family protein [Amycolatopsis sp. WQ 127309]|uniref:quinone oxidoreductase family protein n=1 Tax=Amycolatopsis sp. WQ 127309 TaxID=2932773 RepID=UPI001FF5A893|nr:zinc-binding alcohol dehydrogenase family protein [Amycolatopsis sp. WQ 127309]UOZ03941.1 zinc-binding alcohol dehydrogenase family protein [Amycolatopsis sp. WQ 127309]
MRAAVVTSFGTPPSCQDFPEPAPGTPDEVLVDVLAVGLHPRVRSQADGSHYTESAELPFVPGIDGVGRAPDGRLRYFVLPDTAMGALAERTVVDLRRSVVLPDGVDPVLVAAGMNPAMSAWIALRRRIEFTAGQDVLVLGATGNAGRLAVQVARHLGAGRVVAAGRDPGRLATLPGLGADVAVPLSDVGAAGADVDVVLDYVWGEPTAEALREIVTHRGDRARPLTWIEIGSVAGRTASLPSAALRAARLQLVGSGQGSVPTRDIVAELPALAAEVGRGTFRIDTRTVPLEDVEAAWKDDGDDRRVVIVP